MIEKAEIAPGWRAEARPLNPWAGVLPGSTAHHEALHTVAAILTGNNVEIASNVPGPGYLGKTVIGGEFNAIAFMAAHALGCSGTGHDRAVVALAGHDTEAAASAARSILSGHDREIYAVAALIETKRTISGFEAKEAMERAAKPQTEIKLTGPKGEVHYFVTSSLVPFPNRCHSSKLLNN